MVKVAFGIGVTWVSLKITQRVTSARNAQKYNSEVLTNEPSLNNLFIDSG